MTKKAAKKIKKDRTPEEIVADLAPAYLEWKGGEKEKNKFKTEFFDSITKFLAEEGSQAEDLIYVMASSPDEALSKVEKDHPGWKVDDWRDHPTEPGAYEIIIKEDPRFQSFTIEFGDKVWGRQVVAGPTLLDHERIEMEDLDLYKSITTYPNWKLLEDIAYEAGMDPSECEFEHDEFVGFDGYLEWQCERHGVKRTLLPLEELPDEILAKVQEYVYEGQPSVKLPAPKKVESADG